MSENSEIWNLNALCRCCHKDGYFMSLQETYTYENEVIMYAQILRDTFDLEIQQPPLLEASYTICEMCISRLRDAALFKKQVLTCEKKFEIYCKNELTSTGIEPVKIETYFSDNDYDGNCDNEIEIEIKINDSEGLTKKEDNESHEPCDKKVKDEEDAKPNDQLQSSEIADMTKDDNGNVNKKKRVRKKIKIEKNNKYDPSLEVHVKTDTGTLYSCKLCGGTYEEHKHIKRHILSNHNEGYQCFHCDKTFKTAPVRSVHMNSHRKDIIKCSYCPKTFTTKYSLKLHENTHTKDEIFKCHICSKEFSYNQSLNTHLKGHYGTKRKFVCHVCGHRFNDKTNLGKHIMTVHEKIRPYSCDMCPKTFTAKKHLTVHIRFHTGETPFKCDQCDLKFVTVCRLNYHKASVHFEKGLEKYVCKVCRRRWSNKSLFLKHIRKAHTGQRPYKCTICDKDFTCKYSMKRHVAEHGGIKPFECDLCGVKFAQKGALKRHEQRKHGPIKTGVSEKCDVCNKNVLDLKKHMMCHNNKRFSCEFCGKSYSENNVLTRHKKEVHFGLKPFTCEYCEKKYVKVNSLRNHQMKVHKIVSKVENDEDFDSAVAKFSIKNKKGKIKTEGSAEDVSFN